MPYTYKLHDGRTVIQYIYDSHYEGAEEAAELGHEWATLKGRIDDRLYNDMAARLEYQAGHAICMRDAIVQYFLKLSGIPDDKGRCRATIPDVSKPKLRSSRITPSLTCIHGEDASRGKAVTCAAASGCSAEWTHRRGGPLRHYPCNILTSQTGVAHFTLSRNGQPLVGWAAKREAAQLPWPARRQLHALYLSRFRWKRPCSQARRRATRQWRSRQKPVRTRPTLRRLITSKSLQHPDR